jgi:chromosome segregation ATPase
MEQNEALTKGIVVLQSQLEAERRKGDLWFGKVADLEAALKAERQRADAAVTERNTALKQASAARNGFDEQYKLREKAEEKYTEVSGWYVKMKTRMLKAEEEIAALKAKLANPVVLPSRLPDEGYGGEAVRNWCRNETVADCARRITEAGFTVKGE